MLTMQEIRERWPNPRIADPKNLSQYNPGDYCVGGACVLACGMPWDGAIVFPPYADIADALTHLNSKLSRNAATRYAQEIVRENDAGRFTNAWAVVELALKDRGEAPC